MKTAVDSKAKEREVAIAAESKDDEYPTFPKVRFSAVMRESVTGIPLEPTHASVARTEVAIWYSPRVSAPRTRDRYILKTKESSLVKPAAAVTMANDLKIFFILYDITRRVAIFY